MTLFRPRSNSAWLRITVATSMVLVPLTFALGWPARIENLEQIAILVLWLVVPPASFMIAMGVGRGVAQRVLLALAVSVLFGVLVWLVSMWAWADDAETWMLQKRGIVEFVVGAGVIIQIALAAFLTLGAIAREREGKSR